MTHPHPRAREAAVAAFRVAERERMNWPKGPMPGPEYSVSAAVTAYLAALQETHALVPREATVGMYRALTHSWPDDLQKGVWLLGSFAEDYRAMIDAAPPAAQEKK